MDRMVGLEGVRAQIAMVETPDGHGRLKLTKFQAPSGRGGDGTRRRTPRASAMSRSQSTTSTPSSLACKPAARSSLARRSATKTAIGSATSAARRGSSSGWRSRSAEGSGRPPTASPASVVVPGQDPHHGLRRMVYTVDGVVATAGLICCRSGTGRSRSGSVSRRDRVQAAGGCCCRVGPDGCSGLVRPAALTVQSDCQAPGGST